MENVAQSCFEREQDAREQRRRFYLIDQMISLWRSSAEEYRILPLKYLFLIKEKRAAKLTLNAFSVRILDEYPNIPFFNLTHESEARVWLESKTTPDLEYELYSLEYTLGGNHAYKSLKDWIIDANYKLSHRGKKRA